MTNPNRPFTVIAMTPAFFVNPAIAIAANRAGYIGILDLEFADTSADGTWQAIAHLVDYTRSPIGIKMRGEDDYFVSRMPANLTERLGHVILTPAEEDALRHQVTTLRASLPEARVYLVVTSRREAELAEIVGVDAIIAKGNESGGRVANETAFIFLQRLVTSTRLPIYLQGGVGIHTAGAICAAGAAGVVLDYQLGLAREANLPDAVRQFLEDMDGSETFCAGQEIANAFRFARRLGHKPTEQFVAIARGLVDDDDSARREPDWDAAQRCAVRPNAIEETVWPIGQDGCFAAPLAAAYRTVYGIISALQDAVSRSVDAAVRLRPLAAGGPLAESHGTAYPIVQGPMTRVSDRADFAARVAEGGALPFLALALMRAAEIEPLALETRQAVAGRPWGVGILGFVPPELREEQIGVIQKVRPNFALIAGGSPDQALALEAQGIQTYLHVPSPGLLRLFIEAGATRFVLEGRECGGHVGPRSSFVLWEQMVAVLLEALPATGAEKYHVLFAGGIHDARSAAMVTVLGAEVAARGCKIGLLMGTAYTFTKEAVETNALVPTFQKVICECDHTVELESGAGHITRCAETHVTDAFRLEKQRLLKQKEEPERIRETLERFNVGRLRIASKGVDRHPDYGRIAGVDKLVAVDADYQLAQGLYMIGQVAALRNTTTSIADLHRDVCEHGTELVSELRPPENAFSSDSSRQPAQIAIVGMSCILPGAHDVGRYWENILDRVDAVREVPEDRWDWRDYFDPDPQARDKSYSKWGGFIEGYPFDPLTYGMPPSTLRSIEPLQLLALEAVRGALEDAGYPGGRIPDPQLRRRTSVILGVGGGTGALGQRYAVRSSLPSLMGKVPQWVLEQLPEWTEDSFPGVLLNVTAGRIANRFDLGGVNFTVDAACGSSLAALNLAMREIETGDSDMVIVGGADVFQNPFDFVAFSKTRALSPQGRCRTFDADADGIAISEGVSIVVLRRLADAEREGARVYALIQGTAGSSDGRDRSLTAPRPEGQALALTRAYGRCSIDPATVGLVEAHGTGTAAGDRAEVETLTDVFGAAQAAAKSCGLGSVKSMIGHTKAAAGTTGLIKIALALHHQVLPPTLNVQRPNPVLAANDSPFYLLAEPRPWIARPDGSPRRAGVSAFGFGGTNFHAVLEEYRGNYVAADVEPLRRRWPVELFLMSAGSRADLVREVERCSAQLRGVEHLQLCDLCFSLVERFDVRAPARLAVIAKDIEELRGRLEKAIEWLGADRGLETGAMIHVIDPRGAFFSDTEVGENPDIAFLFPGQGSQYPNMLRDLAVLFAPVRDAFARADSILHELLGKRLSDIVFPPSAYDGKDAEAQRLELTRTEIAQPAIGAASVAMSGMLESFGLAPTMVAGHSFGEYVALHRAGAIDEATLLRLSELRGRCIIETAREDDLGSMASVGADADRVRSALGSLVGVEIANLNAPDLTVIAGPSSGIAAAQERLEQHGLSVRRIPVACGFHSPCVAPASARLAAELARAKIRGPLLPVYSNITAAPYPRQSEEVQDLLSRHLVSRVDFVGQINAMYRDGAQVFVEVGPNSVLTKLVGRILGGRRHLALASDSPQRSGLAQLLHLLGQLAVAGIGVELKRLFAGRNARRVDLNDLRSAELGAAPSASSWLVTGGYARPKGEPPPARRRPPAAEVAAQAVANNDTERLSEAPPAAVLADPVMVQYLHLNKQFLETQTRVVLAYLQGRGKLGSAEAAALAVPAQPSVATPSEAEGLAAPMPEAAVPDSATAQEQAARSHGEAEWREASTIGDSGSSALEEESLRTALLELVGERTGYPAEMLELDLNLEADLGIDSIKRTEILGAFRKRLFPDGGDATVRGAVEKAAQERTLRGIIARFAALAHAAQTPAQRTEAAEIMDEVALREALLELVGERTGYPAEMLELDLNLEADLGIDSIKRTEILGAFRKRLFPEGGDARVRAAIEQAAQERTLRGIIARFATLKDTAQGRVSARSSRASEPGASTSSAGAEDEALALPRFLVKTTPLPHTRRPFVGAAGGIFLVTDDETGVAARLVDLLCERGAAPVLLRQGPYDSSEKDVATLDLTDPEQVRKLRDSLGDLGALAGIFHCLPLRPMPGYDELSLPEWRDAVRSSTKSLFNLAMVFDAELRGERPCVLVTAIRLGGDFGVGAESGVLRVDHAGPGGLLKTLAKEWPNAHCRCVDFEEGTKPAEVAERLLAEAARDGHPVEIGYQEGLRLCLTAELAPLVSGPAHIHLDADSVVLLTGGARGITAEIAHELAQLYRPTLVLCGSSPPPSIDEPEDISGIADNRELKARLMKRLGHAGEVRLAEVELEFRRVQKEREIRANLRACRDAGAKVEYHQIDVRDERALTGLIDSLYDRFGRLDGVVHGAGVVEDKLIGDKTGDSFDRVVETKVLSTFVLTRQLRLESLQFLVLFTSVAGRFGNRGQSDYAAANEILSKLALHLDRRWRARVVAVSWGPWDKTGMVSAEIKRQFAQLGIEPVSPQLGRRALDRELRLGRRGEPEVIWGDGPWRSDAPPNTDNSGSENSSVAAT